MPLLLTRYDRLRSVSVWHAVWLSCPDLHGADRWLAILSRILTNRCVLGCDSTPQTIHDGAIDVLIMTPGLADLMEKYDITSGPLDIANLVLE